MIPNLTGAATGGGHLPAVPHTRNDESNPNPYLTADNRTINRSPSYEDGDRLNTSLFERVITAVTFVVNKIYNSATYTLGIASNTVKSLNHWGRSIFANSVDSAQFISMLKEKSITPNDYYYVTDDVHLSDIRGLHHIPGNIEIATGVLTISDCPDLEYIGKVNLGNCGDLSISDCSSLQSLQELANTTQYDNLTVELKNCESLEFLSNHWQLKALSITNCPKLKDHPGFLNVGSTLSISECDNFQTLPPCFKQARSLSVSKCAELTNLGNDINLGGDLYSSLSITDCPKLTSLPDDGSIRTGSNYITNCPELKSIPDTMLDPPIPMLTFKNNPSYLRRLTDRDYSDYTPPTRNLYISGSENHTNQLSNDLITQLVRLGLLFELGEWETYAEIRDYFSSSDEYGLHLKWHSPPR